MRLRLIFRMLWATPWLTLFKILSLGLGIAISGFLLMRVAHDQSVDTCFPDYDRIYQLWIVADMDNRHEELPMSTQSFAEQIAEKMGDRIESYGALDLGVYGDIVSDLGKVPGDGGEICYAGDRAFFETMGIEFTEGSSAHKGSVGTAWIDEEMARELFGNESAIGHSLRIYNTTDFIVAGIYKTIPEESTLRGTRIVIRWPGGNSSNGMSKVYIKLKKGTDWEAMSEEIGKLWQAGGSTAFRFDTRADMRPLRATFQAGEKVKNITLILAALAGMILFVTSFNYVLLGLSTLSRRAKMVGVRKCCGESNFSVGMTFVGETAVIMLGALVVAAACVWASGVWFRDTLFDYVVSYASVSRLWVLGVVILTIFLLSAVIPAMAISRIPVAHVFRRFKSGKSGWKVTLLLVQLLSTTLAVGLTAVIINQNHLIENGDLGFNHDRLVKVSADWGIRSNLADMVTGLPYVEAVTSSRTDPGTFSGNTAFPRPDGNGSVLAARLTFQTSAFRVLEIPIIAGTVEGVTVAPESPMFQSGVARDVADVAVSREFVERMGWTVENVVGTTYVYEEGDIGYVQPYRILAVYEDFVNTNYFEAPIPSIACLDNNPVRSLLVRLKAPFDENLNRLTDDMARAFPDEEIITEDYADILAEPYSEVRSFRTLSLLACAVILFVTAIGLLAYLRDETARRTKEIAICKINGATTSDVVNMLIGSVLTISIPAILVGAGVAWYVGSRWLDQFAVKADNSAALILLSAVIMALVVASAVALMSLRTALDNPVKSLKSE